MNTISHRALSGLAIGLMCLSLVACDGNRTVPTNLTPAPSAGLATPANPSGAGGDQLEDLLIQLEQGLNSFDTLGDFPDQ